MAAPSRQERAVAHQEQLIDVALDLFARQGFAATSTQQIAKAAGVAQGLIFHYFGSKEGLLSAVLASRRSFATDMPNLLASVQVSQMPLGEVLRAVCRQWFDTLRHETSATLLLTSLALTDAHFGERLTRAVDNALGELSDFLEQRRRDGEVRVEDDLRVAAHDILIPVIVFFLLHHCEPDWEQAAEHFVESHCSFWQRALGADIEA